MNGGEGRVEMQSGIINLRHSIVTYVKIAFVFKYIRKHLKGTQKNYWLKKTAEVLMVK